MSIIRVPSGVTVTRAGLAPTLSGTSTTFLAGDGTYAIPAGTASGLLTFTTTLNDTTIKALPTTVTTILASPGAGVAIIPITYQLYGQFVAPYTNIDAGGFSNFRYGAGQLASSFIGNDTTTTPALALLTTCFGTTADWIIRALPYLTVVEPASSGWGVMPQFMYAGDIVDKEIQIVFDNGGSGDLTGGNVANTLKITTFYTTLTMP